MHYIDTILEPAFWWAADWSLRWAALLAAVALMLWILRPRRAALRQLILLVSLAAGLLVSFAPRWGKGWERTSKQSTTLEPTQPLNESRTEKDPGERGRVSAPRKVLGALTRPRSPSERVVSRGANATPLAEEREPLGSRRLIVLSLVSCWVLAVACQLMRCVCGWIFLRREAVEAAGALAELYANCRAELRVRSAVLLTAHPRVRSPILLGLWRPLIVVPPDWPQRSIESQRAGLLHELAHVRRRDHWLAPILEIVRIAFFFHPFVRWLLARLEHERELLCDEMVVDRGIDPRAYARLLVELARTSGRLAWPAASLPMGRRRTIKGRIHHLLEEDMERWVRPLPLRWAVVMGSGLLALTLGLASYQVLAVEKPQPDPTANAEKAKPEAFKEGEKKADSKQPADDAIKRENLRYGGKDFYQWRRELLTELKPSIRADGLVALGTFGANGFGTEATQAILNMMHGYDPGLESSAEIEAPVVKAGYAAILKIRMEAVPALTEAVKDDNCNVRLFAIESLRRFGGDAQPAIPTLLQAFKSKDLWTCRSAIQAVGQIDRGNKDIVAALIELLSDKRLKDSAIDALTSIGEPAKPAIPALLKALSDKEEGVRRSAIWALRQIGAGAEGVPAVSRLLQDRGEQVAELAFQYLDRLKPEEIKEAVPALAAALKDPQWAPRAINLLVKIGPGAKEAVPALDELLRSDDAQVRNSAIKALKKISPDAKR